MDELDTLASRSSDSVHQLADRIADTESALRDLHADIASAPAAPTARSRRWIRVSIAAAAVVAVAIGAVLLTDDDHNKTISSTVPSIVEPDPTITSVPDTEPSTVPSPPSPVTSPVSSPPAPQSIDVDLGNGLSLNELESGPIRIRHVDTMPNDPGARADYAVDMTFLDDTMLRVTLGSNPAIPGSLPTTLNGAEAWAIEEQPGEVATAIKWKIDDSTWIRVQSLRRLDQRTPGNAEYVGTVLPLEQLRGIAESVTYDPSFDRRLTPMATTFGPTERFQCSKDVAVHGGGPDMVLFTCDGTLAIYSGTTGEQVELIRQFEALATPFEGEGSGPEYVDGIAVSPDGSTIYFSTGPEPVAGNMYRYVRGSGQPPERIGFGYGPSVSSSGYLLATIALNSISTFDTTESTYSASYDLGSTYPTPPLVWSPDGTKLAFEAGVGVIGVIDFSWNQDVRLYASDIAGQWLVNPYFAEDGTLMANTFCCEDQEGMLQPVVVGPPGNNRPQFGDPVVGLTAPATMLFTPAGDQVFIKNGDVGPVGTDPWASGVLAAAFFAPPG